MTVRRGYADAGYGAIHYASAGSGEPMVLLHAVPRSGAYFRHALPLLAPHFRAIAMDIPGFGLSDPVLGTPDMRTLAESVVRLLDALGLERAHLFGLHTGNKIAAAFAALFPDRLHDLLIVGQTHSIMMDKASRDAAIRAIAGHYFPQYGASPDGSHHLRGWAAAHAELQAMWWPQRLRTGSDLTAFDVELAEAQAIDYLHGWRSLEAIYAANFSFDLAAHLAQARARTLVLEWLTPGEMHFGEQAGPLARTMKNAVAAAIEGDGEVMETDPARVVAAVLRFFGK